jgi:hypothetical protein
VKQSKEKNLAEVSDNAMSDISDTEPDGVSHTVSCGCGQ